MQLTFSRVASHALVPYSICQLQSIRTKSSLMQAVMTFQQSTIHYSSINCHLMNVPFNLSRCPLFSHIFWHKSVWLYLEVVSCVAISVLGYVQENEEVLPQVVSHSSQPWQTVLWETEVHHLGGRTAWWLDELSRKHLLLEKIISIILSIIWA